MRRPLLLALALATLALALFGAWFAFGHEPVSELSRGGEIAYASLLLAPPLLFLLFATVLEGRRGQRVDVLGMLALAALVGTPAVLYFLGLLGIAVELAALALLAVAAWRQRDSHPHSEGLRR